MNRIKPFAATLTLAFVALTSHAQLNVRVYSPARHQRFYVGADRQR